MSNQGDDRSGFFDYPIGKIIVGFIFLGSAFWLFGVFNDLETGVIESIRINWLVAFLYNSLGPTITLILLVLFGLAAILFGFYQFFTEQDA